LELPNYNPELIFIVVIVGVFGLGEVFTNLESLNRQSLKPIQDQIQKDLDYHAEEWKRSIGPNTKSHTGWFFG